MIALALDYNDDLAEELCEDISISEEMALKELLLTNKEIKKRALGETVLDMIYKTFECLGEDYEYELIEMLNSY